VSRRGAGQFELPFSFGGPPERRSLIIEAGAGTGKTTSIVAELLSILIDEPDLKAERIVLVTFTEKAAGEIAARIREAVADLHETVDTPSPQWPARSATPIFRVEPAQRERARAAILSHYAQIDRFYSQTIHSFCQRILRMYPLQASLNPQFALVEGYERNRIYHQIYAEWLQRETVGEREPEWISDWDAALAHLHRLDAIRGLIFTFLPKRDLLAEERYTLGELSEAEPVLQKIIAGLRAVTSDQLAAVDDPAVRVVLEHLRDNAPPQEGLLQQWIDYLLPISDALAAVNLNKVPKELKLEMGFIRGKKKEENLFARLTDHAAAAVMRRLALRFFEHLDREKKHRGIVDFDDLLLRTASLLRDNGVLEQVRSHFDYIFVDEFQDTDRVQAEIVDRLSRDVIGRLVPGRTVLVGDPKQSIYSFRRADPETYESTVRRFIADGAAERPLTGQYRSDAPLVDALNAMFAQLFSAPSTRNVARPDYEELTAKKEALIRELDARITFLRSDEPDDVGPDERQAIAVAEWIRSRVNEGSDYRRFALLLRKLSNVELYLEVFDRYGIPYLLPPTRAFLEKRAPVDLLSVLRAIAFPFDAGAMISAVRSPYLAVTDTQIARHVLSPSATDGTFAEAERKVRIWAADAPHMSVSGLIDRVVAESGIELLYRTVEGGDRDLLFLDGMREIAAEFDLRAGGPVARFVEEIERRRDESEEGEPSWIDESQDAIVVMSVHAAKGLEFETVILADLSSGMAIDSLRVNTVDDPPSLIFTGRLDNLAGEFRESGGVKLSEIARDRAKAEVDRLFYVAVTRAKSDVVFVTDGKDRNSAFWACLQRIFAIEPRTAPAQFPPGAGRIVRSLPVGLRGLDVAFERVVPREEESVERPRLRIVPESLPDTEPPLSEPLERLGAGEIATLRAAGANRLPGIALHRLLELWDGSPSTLPAHVEAVAAEQRLPAAAKGRMLERAKAAARSEFFQMIRAAETVGRELPIHYLDDAGNAVEGRIDRLIFDGSRYLVVDYKSGKPISARLEKDREQVARYCEAVARMTGKECEGALWYIDLDEDRVIRGISG
jgi:ATP-dependent helicase/nuclease subunit A